jgi:MraZ protein
MPASRQIILGEFPGAVDERFRVSVPKALVDLLTGGDPHCILAKERSGCLSLWNAAVWEEKLQARIRVLEEKLKAGSFDDDRVAQVQLLGRLLSTRHLAVELRSGSRLQIPESFRAFLGVEPDAPGNKVLVVGAAVCVEIWRPAAWQDYLERRMPRFRRVFHRLSR